MLGQLSGFAKGGLTYGTINKDWWYVDFGDLDSIRYGKPLVRPFFGYGVECDISPAWQIRQEVLFQVKGQGTSVPTVQSAFLRRSPDILRCMSFPFSIQRRIVPNFYMRLGIQPSLYLSGADNYYAHDNWRGWLWGAIIGVQFQKDRMELGLEYDHDLMHYYCGECDHRFFNIRLYGAYHFSKEYKN